MKLENRTALITGGALGIGRATASAFLDAGSSVIITDINSDAGEDCISALKHKGPVTFLHGDVALESTASAAAALAESSFGRLDFLINNAASSAPGRIEELSLEQWNRVLAVNLTAAFLFTKHCAPLLRKTRGCIVNIASTRAIMSEAATEAYSASKGGLLALTHATAVSLGPDIRVNAVSPGWIDTSAWRTTAESREPQHSDADRLQHPAGRVGRPEDVTSLILHLCSDNAGFITGANFTVDGGMTRKMIYV